MREWVGQRWRWSTANSVGGKQAAAGKAVWLLQPGGWLRHGVSCCSRAPPGQAHRLAAACVRQAAGPP